MERFLCIHGHFYQPPRENPWLESVEIQDSAHPYHDGNEAARNPGQLLYCTASSVLAAAEGEI